MATLGMSGIEKNCVHGHQETLQSPSEQALGIRTLANTSGV